MAKKLHVRVAWLDRRSVLAELFYDPARIEAEVSIDKGGVIRDHFTAVRFRETTELSGRDASDQALRVRQANLSGIGNEWTDVFRKGLHNRTHVVRGIVQARNKLSNKLRYGYQPLTFAFRIVRPICRSLRGSGFAVPAKISRPAGMLISLLEAGMFSVILISI